MVWKEDTFMSRLIPDETSKLFTKRRRAIISCKNCRSRKVKCSTLADGDLRPCTRCTAKGLQCDYTAVDETAHPPTTIACLNCKKSKIRCATVTDGNCRPCTQCQQKGLKCEYPDPNKYPWLHSGQHDDLSPLNRDQWGFTQVPTPITPPSAGVQAFLEDRPDFPRVGDGPMPHAGPSTAFRHHYSSPRPPGTMPIPTQPVPSQLHGQPEGFSSNHQLPQYNPSAQYYSGVLPNFGVQNLFIPLYAPNYENIFPPQTPDQQQMAHPAAWPQTNQSSYPQSYNPNASGLDQHQ
ncbi:hypothetical protein R3P38DRAFT_1956304 [Favolaschia claudopus]|uniref:Zn(2)-C6 fungal-type domain-containing protein n=1 Tax=Favolaschia claudopus TaxID=2862362 RepID=A0AAW0A153_9AGAR